MNEPEIVENAGLWGGRLLVFESLPSTNKWALDNAAACRNGDVIRAVQQTEGYGRFQREWFSPANRCLTISIIIKRENPEDLFLSSTVSQLATLAVRSVLEKYSIKALVKWPNDVLVNGGKIAGILAEGEPREGLVVLGIGLNVNLTTQDLNSTLLQPATSMAEEKGKTFDVARVCGELMPELEAMFRQVQSEHDWSLLLDTWKHHDFLAGKRIEVQTTDGTMAGQYAGLDEKGRLGLIDETGHEHHFWAGDVSLAKD